MIECVLLEDIVVTSVHFTNAILYKKNDQDAYIRDSNCSVLLYVQLLDTVAVSAYKLSTKFANYTQMVSETVDVCKESH